MHTRPSIIRSTTQIAERPDSLSPPRVLLPASGRSVFRSLDLAPVAISMLVMLSASALGAQEAIRCVDDPILGIPAECASFAFDIETTSVSDPGGVFGALAVGETVSGSYTVYTASVDFDGTEEGGRYLNAVECMTLDLDDRILTVDLTPFEISLPPAPSDPGITVLNDAEQGAPPFTLVTDTATFAIAGPGVFRFNPVQDPPLFVFGGGGFAFGYGNSCVSGIQTPCPPLVLVDDGLPPAPGDTTGLLTAQMTFDYLTLENEFATANADLLAIDPTPVVACPEPGFATALMIGTLALGATRKWSS